MTSLQVFCVEICFGLTFIIACIAWFAVYGLQNDCLNGLRLQNVSVVNCSEDIGKYASLVLVNICAVFNYMKAVDEYAVGGRVV